MTEQANLDETTEGGESPAVEEQDEGFGDDVAEGGGGQTSPPPEPVEDDLTEGGAVDPSP